VWRSNAADRLQFNRSQHERLEDDAGGQGLMNHGSFEIAFHFQTVRNIKSRAEVNVSPFHVASNSASVAVAAPRDMTVLAVM
jgi:hypothetical protein